MSEKLQDIINQQQDQIDPEENMDDIVQLVGFVIGEEEFSVPILSIQEIIKPIDWTRVPRTPEYVLGVFNLRGTVIPLIDLRLKFGLRSEKMTENSRFMVMKKKQQVLLLIDLLKPFVLKSMR